MMGAAQDERIVKDWECPAIEDGMCKMQRWQERCMYVQILERWAPGIIEGKLVAR